MKVLLVLLTGLIGVCVTMVFAREHLDQGGVEVRLRAGDAAGAYARCRSLEGRSLWFLDRPDVASQCEGAAREALVGALHEERFEPAASYCAAIASAPDTGFENGVRTTCRDLGPTYVRYISRLVSRGEEERALRETNTGEQLFGDQADVVSGLRMLRAEAQAGQFEHAVASGDAEAAFRSLTDLEPTAPAAVVRRVEEHINDAWTLGVAKHIGGHNFPAVLELYERLRKSLQPELRYGLALAYRDSAQQIFSLPSVSDIRDVLDEDPTPPVTAVDQTRRSRRAEVTFTNRTERPLWIVLRGEAQDYRIGPIPPGDSRPAAIRPGRYAEAAHTGSGVHPFIGVIQVPEATFTQEFAIDERSVRGATTGRTIGRRL